MGCTTQEQNIDFVATDCVCDNYSACGKCVSYHHQNGGLPKCFSEQKVYDIEKKRKVKENLEKIKLEAERKRKERLEQERIEREKLLAEREEKERLAKIEAERKEKERLEKEKLEAEKKEKERLEKEKLEAEKLEKERLEQEKIENEKKNGYSGKYVSSPHPLFIEVFFRCCSVYGKLYLNVKENYYVGKCPRCRADLTAPIGGNKMPTFGLRQQKHRCLR